MAKERSNLRSGVKKSTSHKGRQPFEPREPLMLAMSSLQHAIRGMARTLSMQAESLSDKIAEKRAKDREMAARSLLLAEMRQNRAAAQKKA
jgi:hypothetical protein